MALVVQKYGGSLISDINSLHKIADSIIACKNAANSVIAVVSAKVGMTDSLMQMAKAANPNASGKNLDILLSVGEQCSSALLGLILESRGVRVDVKTGARVGIYSDCNGALSVDVAAFNDSLSSGNVIVVSGFQALTSDSHVVTLGRGGSDLTAVVLAHNLNACKCEIYKDIGCVLRISPKILPNENKIKKLSHRDAFLMASLGAKIIQARAADFAYSKSVPFKIVSIDSESEGTMIDGDESAFSCDTFWVALSRFENVYAVDRANKSVVLSAVKSLKKRKCRADFVEYLDKIYVTIDLTDDFCKNMLEKEVGEFFTSFEKMERLTIVGKNRQPSHILKTSPSISKVTNMFSSHWMRQ